MAIIKKGDNIIDVIYKGAGKDSEPTQYGAYNIEVIEKDDGTQELHITDAVEKPVDRLQWKCDNMKSLFYEFRNYKGESLNDILQGLDTSNVTDMGYMFYGCSKLTSIPMLDTSNVTNMSNMFSGCSVLETIPLLDTSNVTDMSGMFNNAHISSIPKWNTSNVTDMSGMFYSSAKFTELDLSGLDTSSVTDMDSMFYNCMKLTTLNLSGWDTSNVTYMGNMFGKDKNLTTILGTIDVNKVRSNLTTLFDNCTNLTTVTLKNIKKALTIGSGTTYGTLLDDPTVINTAKELWDLTGATSQKLTVSTPTNAKLDTIYVKLITATDDMIANDPNINSKKPCEVCASTDEGAMTLREYIISKNWSIA